VDFSASLVRPALVSRRLIQTQIALAETDRAGRGHQRDNRAATSTATIKSCGAFQIAHTHYDQDRQRRGCLMESHTATALEQDRTETDRSSKMHPARVNFIPGRVEDANLISIFRTWSGGPFRMMEAITAARRTSTTCDHRIQSTPERRIDDIARRQSWSSARPPASSLSISTRVHQPPRCLR